MAHASEVVFPIEEFRARLDATPRRDGCAGLELLAASAAEQGDHDGVPR